jgi:hypothetical protein
MLTQLTSLIDGKSPNAFPQLLRNNPLVLDWLLNQTKHINDIKNNSERIYIIINGKPPKCKFGNKLQFNTFLKGYRKGCILGNKCRCIDDHRRENQNKTLIEKYGTSDWSELTHIVSKRKNTMMERYGVESAAQSPVIKEKQLESLKNRSIQDQINSNNKRIQTSLEKYGVEHHMKLGSQREKLYKTNLDRYGSKTPLGNKDILNKSKITYAKHNPLDIDNKRKLTMMDRYGVKATTQMHFTDLAKSILLDKESFISFVSGKSRGQVIDELNITENGLYKFNLKYDAFHLYIPPKVSRFELEVQTYLNSLEIEYEMNNRQIIKPVELDFYIPKLNMAIECCGLYWHSELSTNRGKNYHCSKYQKCKELGIKLITIFEDEWLQKNDKVKSRLRNLMKLNTKSIFARKTEFKVINSKLADEFTENYHLQGKMKSNINLGLYFDNELVSCMTFSKPRFNKNYDYELIRFCSKYNVVGAASKLFSNFIKLYQPNKIVSYSDNRWGTGSVYEKLGFKYLSEAVGYFYTDYKNRYNRIHYQKYKLVKAGYDPALSEWEIMKEQGYDRIWDCGQSTWTWDKT